jgi:hypothetical protein
MRLVERIQPGKVEPAIPQRWFGMGWGKTMRKLRVEHEPQSRPGRRQKLSVRHLKETVDRRSSPGRTRRRVHEKHFVDRGYTRSQLLPPNVCLLGYC